MEHFVNLRIGIANLYRQAIEGCDYLMPQASIEDCLNTYWTFVVKYEHREIAWQKSRELVKAIYKVTNGKELEK